MSRVVGGHVVGDRINLVSSTCTIKEEGGINQNLIYDPDLYDVDETNCVLIPKEPKTEISNTTKILIGVGVLVVGYFVFKKKK